MSRLNRGIFWVTLFGVVAFSGVYPVVAQNGSQPGALSSGGSSGALDLPAGQGYPLDLLREIEGNPGKLTLVLRYQGTQGDYLIFYGRRGEPLYLRYREDRFDFRTRHIAENLLRGRIYKVTFQYPEVAPEKKRTSGLIRTVVPLKKGIYLSDELLLPENYRF